MSDATFVAECPLLEPVKDSYLLDFTDRFDVERGDVLTDGDTLMSLVGFHGRGNVGRSTGTQDFWDESVPTGGRNAGRS